jgi:ribulose-5-phosphate 4-epimerase/fuculose-1-phosphate aldolase
MLSMIDPSTFPKVPRPVFATVEEARHDRKVKLAAAFRLFGKYNFDQGVMGHISARDPEYPDHFWINSFGMSFNQIKASDLLRVSLKGELIEGEGYLHPGGVPTHAAVYSVRDDIMSVAHTHATFGTAWSALDRLLDPISSESAVFYQRHCLYDSYKHGEREKLANIIGTSRAIIFKNHGIFAVGESVDEAAYNFITLEKVCQTQLAAEATGRPLKRLEEADAIAIAQRANAYTGWLNFQPAFNTIVNEQPDLVL